MVDLLRCLTTSRYCVGVVKSVVRPKPSASERPKPRSEWSASVDAGDRWMPFAPDLRLGEPSQLEPP